MLCIQVRNCYLVSLNDLDGSKDYVRGKIADYLNDLVDIGVKGFRVDASKHMWPGDLEAMQVGRIFNSIQQTFIGFYVHCKKKVCSFPCRDVPNQTLPWPGIFTLFPPRESLVSDIPAGDGKLANLFLQCTSNIRV